MSGRIEKAVIGICFVIGVLLVGPRALADEQRPLLGLAEAICEQGIRSDSTKLFELFQLKGPLVFMSEGAEMLAAQLEPCGHLGQAEPKSVYLVMGHRLEPGVAVFFLTNMRGELIRAAFGVAESDSGPVYIAVDLTDEIRTDFQAAKTFWMTRCDSSN